MIEIIETDPLWRELFAAQSSFTGLHGRYLDGHNIHVASRLKVGGLGVAEIVTNGDTFQIAPPGLGMSALILPVFAGPIPSPWRLVMEPALIDLLAFRTDQPETFWLRRDNATILGDGALDGLYLDEPLRVYRSPLSWLLAAGDGCVVLDWQAALIELPLRCRTIEAEDLSHGLELRQRLTIPEKLPDIVVPPVREVAA